MKPLELSKRMEALTRMVTEGYSVCDVGCDHGFVSIALVLQRKAPFVIATDVRKGPLQAAQEHIRAYGLEEKIAARLSDGLEKVDAGETDAVLIAGMGGSLMAGILKSGMQKARAFRELILQPQSQIAEFRRFLREEHFRIVAEDMILEDGKYYPMMKAVPENAEIKVFAENENSMMKVVSENEDAIHRNLQMERVTRIAAEEEFAAPLQDLHMRQEWEDAYGPCLLRKGNPVLYDYLCRQRENLAGIAEELRTHPTEKTKKRLSEIQAQREGIEQVLKAYFF